MNTTNNAALVVPAHTLAVGDRVEHFGEFFRVTAARVVTAPITHARSVEVVLAGWPADVVSIPAINTVRVLRPTPCPCCGTGESVERGNGFEDCCDVCAVLDFMVNGYDDGETVADAVEHLTLLVGSEAKANAIVGARRALKGDDVRRFTRPEMGDVTARAMIATWLA